MRLLVQACKWTRGQAEGDMLQERDIRGPCESTEASFTLVLLKTEPGAKIKVKDSLRCASPGRKGEEEKGTEARKKGMWGNAGLQWPGLHSEPQRAITGCGWLNNGPQRRPHPSPQTCEYVIEQRKSNFISVIKLMILWRAECHGVSTWAWWNHKSRYKREAGVSESEKAMWQQKQRSEWCGHEPGNAGGL